jgi:hypothetical protein
MAFASPFAGLSGYEYDDIFDENFNFRDIDTNAIRQRQYEKELYKYGPNPGFRERTQAAMRSKFKALQIKRSARNFKNMSKDFEEDYGMDRQDFSALMKEVFENPDEFVGDVGLPSHNMATKSKGFTTKGNFTDFKKRMKSYIEQARSTFARSIEAQKQEQSMQKSGMMQEAFDKQLLDIQKAEMSSGERAEKDRAKMASQQYTEALAAGQTPMSTTKKSKGMGVIIPQDRPM